MNYLWPLLVREAAEEAFGGSVHNPDGRTFKHLDRLIQHAYGVWERRYQLNPKQMQYAEVVLAWAIRKGHNPDKPYPYNLKAIGNELERVVNDMRAHEGFKRRSELVDVRVALAEALA